MVVAKVLIVLVAELALSALVDLAHGGIERWLVMVAFSGILACIIRFGWQEFAALVVLAIPVAFSLRCVWAPAFWVHDGPMALDLAGMLFDSTMLAAPGVLAAVYLSVHRRWKIAT